MCGILGIIFNDKESFSYNIFDNHLKKIKHRGPDNSGDFFKNIKTDVNGYNIYLGFNRLAINDLSNDGMQPMIKTIDNNNNIVLICNGEIYNYKNLLKEYDLNNYSRSDCEVILNLYHYFTYIKNYSVSVSIEKICDLLDGEFSFLLFDQKQKQLIAVRDHYGVRPLFIGYQNNKHLCFSSELKAISDLCDFVEQVESGVFTIIDLNTEFLNKKLSFTNFTNLSSITPLQDINNQFENIILENINSLFKKAVYKRLMSDKEVCCLLSGGLDSSLVASIVSTKFKPYTLKTFSIGIKGSPDLKYAKIVAEHIKSVHYSIELSEQEFLDAIEDTVKITESYDTTTIRASVGNYLVAKYIKENTNCKVVFNGDYSDEVCGGYKYLKYAPNDFEFDLECKSLIKNIIYFDALRSDRTISSQGLEARVPFSDKAFLEYYLLIPIQMRKPDMTKKKIEKYMLRKAFERENLLPNEILWRPKEAFSDGVTHENRSWHKIISEYVDKKITEKEFIEENNFFYNKPKLKESFLYRKLFEKNYYNKYNVIPYFWLPKWCGNLEDPSAREI